MRAKKRGQPRRNRKEKSKNQDREEQKTVQENIQTLLSFKESQLYKSHTHFSRFLNKPQGKHVLNSCAIKKA